MSDTIHPPMVWRGMLLKSETGTRWAATVDFPGASLELSVHRGTTGQLWQGTVELQLRTDKVSIDAVFRGEHYDKSKALDQAFDNRAAWDQLAAKFTNFLQTENLLLWVMERIEEKDSNNRR